MIRAQTPTPAHQRLSRLRQRTMAPGRNRADGGDDNRAEPSAGDDGGGEEPPARDDEEAGEASGEQPSGTLRFANLAVAGAGPRR